MAQQFQIAVHYFKLLYLLQTDNQFEGQHRPMGPTLGRTELKCFLQ